MRKILVGWMLVSAFAAGQGKGKAPAAPPAGTAKDPKAAPPRTLPREHAPIEDVLARGCACAFVRYTEIEGDPLWNPDRHTYVKRLRWTADGLPDFGDAGLA